MKLNFSSICACTITTASASLLTSRVATTTQCVASVAFFISARDLLLVGVQEGLLDKGVFITTRS